VIPASVLVQEALFLEGQMDTVPRYQREVHAARIELAWLRVVRARDAEREEAEAERDTIPRISIRSAS
jgi:hypothetical protein